MKATEDDRKYAAERGVCEEEAIMGVIRVWAGPR